MLFYYKAQRSTGEVYEETASFDSKDALYALLHKQGDQLITVEERKRVSVLEKLKTISFGGVKDEQKVAFARNLSAMIDAGLPLSRALTVIERQTKNKKFQEIIAELNTAVNSGQSFSDQLKEYPKVFSPLFVSMVKAGEESGKLSDTFAVIADQLERSYKLKKKVKGAMLYPSIIISAMLIIAALMLVFVVPTLTSTFIELNVELPLSTRFVIWISDFLKNNILLSLVLIAAFFGSIFMALRTKGGKSFIHTVILRLPVIGFIAKEVNSARTASTLSSLLSSGVEVVRSIEIAKDVVQNVHYKKVLDEMAAQIKTGGQMSAVLKEHERLYPPFVNEMVAVGEETGKLAELLGRVAEFYESDVEEKTKNISTIIEPVLMIFIGAAVGFFALSMITPMYSLTETI